MHDILANRRLLEPKPKPDQSPRLAKTYTVKGSTWATMKLELLRQVVDDAGSANKAAKLLGVPRSTLGAWLRAKE